MDLINGLRHLPLKCWLAGVAYAAGMSIFVVVLVFTAYTFGGTY